jgi:hypothetical protein
VRTSALALVSARQIPRKRGRGRKEQIFIMVGVVFCSVYDSRTAASENDPFSISAERTMLASVHAAGGRDLSYCIIPPVKLPVLYITVRLHVLHKYDSSYRYWYQVLYCSKR